MQHRLVTPVVQELPQILLRTMGIQSWGQLSIVSLQSVPVGMVASDRVAITTHYRSDIQHWIDTKRKHAKEKQEKKKRKNVKEANLKYLGSYYSI